MPELPEEQLRNVRRLVEEIQEKLDELRRQLRPPRGGGGARDQGGGSG